MSTEDPTTHEELARTLFAPGQHIQRIPQHHRDPGVDPEVMRIFFGWEQKEEETPEQ